MANAIVVGHTDKPYPYNIEHDYYDAYYYNDLDKLDNKDVEKSLNECLDILRQELMMEAEVDLNFQLNKSGESLDEPDPEEKFIPKKRSGFKKLLKR